MDTIKNDLGMLELVRFESTNMDPWPLFNNSGRYLPNYTDFRKQRQLH